MNKKKIEKLKRELGKDFHELYVKEYSTGWRESRLKRDIEIGIMRLVNVERFVEEEIEKSFEEGYQEGKKDMEVGQMLVDDKEFNDLIGKLGEKLSKLSSKENGCKKI